MVKKRLMQQNFIKNILIVISLISNFVSFSQLKNINDTVIINFYQSSGEFGGTDYAFVFTNKESRIIGEYVRYKSCSYPMKLDENLISEYYLKNKNNWYVKYKWKLNDEQILFLNRILKNFAAQPLSLKENSYSNAPEYYFLYYNSGLNKVIIDKTADLKKYIEMRQVFLKEKKEKNTKFYLDYQTPAVVFSVDGLIMEGERYLKTGLKKYQINTVKIDYVNDTFVKEYNYKGSKPVFCEEKLKCITVLNDTIFLFPSEQKKILFSLKETDIDTIFTVKRLAAIKKYGLNKGKNGALIIKTK